MKVRIKRFHLNQLSYRLWHYRQECNPVVSQSALGPTMKTIEVLELLTSVQPETRVKATANLNYLHRSLVLAFNNR